MKDEVTGQVQDGHATSRDSHGTRVPQYCHLIAPYETHRLNWANPTMTLRHTCVWALSAAARFPSSAAWQQISTMLLFFTGRGPKTNDSKTSSCIGLGFLLFLWFCISGRLKNTFGRSTTGRFSKNRGNTRNAALTGGPAFARSQGTARAAKGTNVWGMNGTHTKSRIYKCPTCR